MTTSGTTSFNLELDELIDEAYGRVGIGYLKEHHHSIMFKELINQVYSYIKHQDLDFLVKAHQAIIN
jgi:hypothetical protein